MVDFCCSSQPHALSLETKGRAQPGNYYKMQKPARLHLSHQGFCAARSSETAPPLNVRFLVRSGTGWKSARQRWGSSKHRDEKKRRGGGNQMQQMHAGRKEDRLAAEQKQGRAVVFTNRPRMLLQKGAFQFCINKGNWWALVFDLNLNTKQCRQTSTSTITREFNFIFSHLFMWFENTLRS